MGARRARKQGLSAGFRTRPVLLKCAMSKILFVSISDGSYVSVSVAAFLLLDAADGLDLLRGKQR